MYWNPQGGPIWGPGTHKILVDYTPDDDELLARVQLTYVGLQILTEVDTAIAVLVG